MGINYMLDCLYMKRIPLKNKNNKKLKEYSKAVERGKIIKQALDTYKGNDIVELLNHTLKLQTKLLKEGRICANCGTIKEPNLTDWCYKCLDDE